MKSKITVLAIVLSISVGAMAQPATVWMNTYGSTSTGDWANHVIETSDGSFVVTGVTDYFFMGAGGNIYLGKMDSFGNLMWNWSFAPAQSDEGMCVQETADDGFIITGKTGSLMDYNVHLLKTDFSGGSLWAWTYGTIGMGTPDLGHHVEATSDGGFIVTGETAVTGNGLDVYLLKTDAQGVEEWSASIGGPGYECGYEVHQTADGGYIICGFSDSYGGGDSDLYLLKTDANGNEEWHQVFGGPNEDYGYSVKATPDGGYIMAGMTTGYGDLNGDVYIIKTDAGGAVEWIRHPGGDAADEGRSVVLTSDGGYVITGSTSSFGSGMSDVYLVKYDAQGSLEWELAEGTADNEMGYCGAECADGGYIVSGLKSTGAMSSEDILLVKFGEAAPPDYELTLTPLNPPVQIPANGGTFDYNILADNNGPMTAVVDFWIMATLPDGSEYGPIIQVNDFVINAYASVTRDRIQTVPGNAPAGDYVYTGYLGNYPNVINSESGFVFEKEVEYDGGRLETGWECDGGGFDNLSGTEDSGLKTVESHQLFPAYPNPFNNQAAISFKLAADCGVELKIYDVTGREAASLVNGRLSAGRHEVTWNAEGMTSGVYFARLQAGGAILTEMLLLIQ